MADEAMTYGFGRIVSPVDERDYKLKTVMDVLMSQGITARAWDPGSPAFDQKDTGHCVGFGGAGWERCTPVVDPGLTDQSGHDLYYKCKALDADGPANLEGGSTVRTLAKVLKNLGRAPVYAFAASVPEAAEYVSKYGPIVLGITWTYPMTNVGASGIIVPGSLAPDNIAGGHCILWTKVDAQFATLRNSWGPTWGAGGDCRISLSDLAFVFADQGEAMAALEAPLVTPTPDPTPTPTPDPTPTPTPDPTPTPTPDPIPTPTPKKKCWLCGWLSGN